MLEEFRHHIEMRTEDLMRSGIPAREARRQAHVEFGYVEGHREDARAASGLRFFHWIGLSWLDFKLGFRMVRRYPGLTTVSVLAMGFAVWAGASTFEFVNQILAPRIPLDEGDRIVGIQLLETHLNQLEEQALWDFERLREDVSSIEDLGAYRTVQRNLFVRQDQAEAVPVAQISPSAFSLARVPPLLGRVLVPSDEQAGAPSVVVIGYDVWQDRFEGSPEIVGRTIHLDAVETTVVGVMPEGFEFPVAHEMWTPLRLREIDYDRRAGPAISIFGRLVPGVSLDQAQAELDVIARGTAGEFPDTHQFIRPSLLPYGRAALPVPPTSWTVFTASLVSFNLAPLALLLLIGANVALLIFARAATRESEIVVRSALGASRGRIVGQLFAEALVLGSIAAVVGLATARYGLRWALYLVELEVDSVSPVPFWFDSNLSPATIGYVAVFTVAGAAIAGVLPALKITRGLSARLREATAGGGGVRLGGIWTLVVVTQVAFTMLFPLFAMELLRERAELVNRDVDVPVSEYLAVGLEMDEATVASVPSADSGSPGQDTLEQRYRMAVEELARRVEEEPGVIGSTFGDVLPGMYHPVAVIDVNEGGTVPAEISRHRASRATVALNYFSVVGVSVLAGREFDSADLSGNVPVAIVNESFTERIFEGRNPIGRLVRFVDSEDGFQPTSEEVWYEIVGIVEDAGTTNGYGRAGIYLPMTLGSLHPIGIAIHVRGDPTDLAPAIHRIAADLDPALQLHGMMSLDRAIDDDLAFMDFWLRLIAIVSGLAVVLSVAGIFAVMSFTASRRTREVGLRIALGAESWRVVASVFRKPLRQVGIGIAVGSLLAGLLSGALDDSSFAGTVGFVAAYAVVATAICTVACVVPTRRALAVEPVEALRVEG
jgi:predicted permease